MSTFLSLGPYPVLYPCITRSHTLQNPIFHRSHLSGFSGSNPHLRGTLTVAKFGFFNSGQFPVPEPESAERVIRELFGKAEGILFTLADAAVTNSEAVGSAKENNGDWLSGITNYMESVLKVLKGGLSTLHVPYAYGFAIILLTVLVKAVTFPLTKKQVESAMAMRSLQPQLKAIQKQYAGDQERIQLETARLYKLAGINPLAGCLPTLATIPVWIGLYRALSNVANEGLLTEGFFWIPSLAGPTTIAARQNGSGISWLFPFVDGHPPLGWSDTTAYLVLPVLLIASQYISIQIMQSSQTNDPNLKSSQILTKFLPLMIGYFSLSVPSGLSLYWFTNNILSTAQQVWLQKLGGAKNPLGQINDDTLKEDQQQSQITSFETKATGQQSQITSFETEAIQKEEKVTSTGLPPGERFRRLKEEEARRKRKRQEELMRKAEEAAATNAQQLKEEGHEKQPNQVDGTNGTMSELVDESVDKSHPVAAAQELSDNRVAVNGNTSNEHHGASVSVQENDIPSSDTSSSRISHLDEDNSEKESVGIHGNSTFMDGQIQGEEQSGQK